MKIILDDASWLNVFYMDKEITNKLTENYKKIWNLHPEKRGKVIVYDKEKEVNRWYRSYLKTPHYNPFIKHSYMFSSKDGDGICDVMPDEFDEVYKFISNYDNNYNQLVVNWYENGNDFISSHTDCEDGFIDDAKISIITINEDDKQSRKLIIKKNEIIVNTIDMKNGMIVEFHGNANKDYRHGIEKDDSIMTSRISFTFRQFK
jgi:alkylated DNA repair dioxygenase AlkB